jgi:hypothetical protein
MENEILTLINGNGQNYNIGLPKIVILHERFNDVAMQHIFNETGLRFKGTHNMETQPENSQQIVKLFLTYNFKTQYHNNNTNHNTLFLKICNDAGFKTDSICFDCVKANYINSNGLVQGDRLAV